MSAQVNQPFQIARADQDTTESQRVVTEHGAALLLSPSPELSAPRQQARLADVHPMIAKTAEQEHLAAAAAAN